MRLALLMLSLASLLAVGARQVAAQQGYHPVAYSAQENAVYPLPPLQGQMAVPSASPPVPEGHWVFVPAGAGSVPVEQSSSVLMPQPTPEQLPTPAVTEFAHVTVEEAPIQYNDRLGPTVRIFEPKARVYFDTGWEAPDKLNLFHDGSLSASINFLELYWQHRWPQTIGALDLPLGHPDWRWGPALGIGIAPQPGDSSDGTQTSSGAPVLMLSAGLQFDFPLVSTHEGRTSQLPTAGVEVGYALGVSSDESLDYIADGAIYVGVTIHVLP